MTPLQSFLEAERRELASKMVVDVYTDPLDETNQVIDWLSDHDTRLLAFVRKMVEKRRVTQRDVEPIGAMCLEFADGYDNAVEDILRFLTPPTKV